MEELKQTGWYAEHQSGHWKLHTGDDGVDLPDALSAVLSGMADKYRLHPQSGTAYFTLFHPPYGVTHVVRCFQVGAMRMAGQLVRVPIAVGSNRNTGKLAETPAGLGSPNLAHALKAPVSRIIGLTEVLLASGNIAGEDRRLVGYIEESAKKLRQLFGRVLQPSSPGLLNTLRSRGLAQSMSQFIELHAPDPSAASVDYIRSAEDGNDHIVIHGLASVNRLFTDEQGMLTVPAGLIALHDALNADALVFTAAKDGSMELCICHHPVYSAVD